MTQLWNSSVTTVKTNRSVKRLLKPQYYGPYVYLGDSYVYKVF